MKNLNAYKTLDQACNAYVRGLGRSWRGSKATHIHVSPDPDAAPFSVTKVVDYGYRKATTGEYVPHAYRRNFGWKNTYYQAAETHVTVSAYVDLFFRGVHV